MIKPEIYGQKRNILRMLVTLGFLSLLIIGISSCNLPAISDILPVSDSTEAPSEDILTPTPLSTATPEIPLDAPRQLIIWLPPQFDPEVETTAGNLLSSRLDEFMAQRGQTNIQIRVKSLSGEFGLLESLQLTDSAAPLLMPDLVALPRFLLEEAFQEELVMPLDEYLDDSTENDWYEYALDLAKVDGQIAGIPFAGDLMVLAYKDTAENPPPTDWSTFLSVQRAVSFPASDPRGLVTLAWYQSLGGELRGEDGKPTLDEDLMLQVLNFYDQAQDANVMPYWLTQFETIDQAWASYLERQSTLAITWTSRILGSDSPNTLLAAMPTKDDKAFTYADGWVWCVVPSNLETEQFALELAEFLSDSEFLNTWAIEGGYIPVRPSSLESWSDTPYYSTLNKLLPAALLVPEGDLESIIGPAIRDAVVEVLKDQVDPEEALETLMGEVLE
jgi:ABC-type glycerol-3-phosphate transport system substrate-binding protein